MQTIKKYANRKLYHTNRKQYITLDGIAELIQAGEPVEVIDNETGANITATILSQVVLTSRGHEPALPTSFLTNLIQSSGDRLAGVGRSVWAMLGGAAAVDAEIRRRIQRARDAGALSADEAARIQRLLVPPEPVDEPQEQAPTAGDIARLSAQVEALTAAVEQLLAEREASHTQRRQGPKEPVRTTE